MTAVLEPLSPCPHFPFSCVCSRDDAPDRQRVTPLVVSGDPRAAFARLRSLVAELPRTIVVTATASYLHAECRSPRGFVDDLECRLCASGPLIHVRSASRIGLLWDMDTNRRRVEALRRRLQETQPG